MPAGIPLCRSPSKESERRMIMQWTTPEFTEIRFGFEITMYIANR